MRQRDVGHATQHNIKQSLKFTTVNYVLASYGVVAYNINKASCNLSSASVTFIINNGGNAALCEQATYTDGGSDKWSSSITHPDTAQLYTGTRSISSFD